MAPLPSVHATMTSVNSLRGRPLSLCSLPCCALATGIVCKPSMLRGLVHFGWAMVAVSAHAGVPAVETDALARGQKCEPGLF